jgi:release factor glutamine methyltransferase
VSDQPAKPEPTLATLLQQAVFRIADQSGSARFDAELLLSQALGKPRSFLYAWPDHAPTATVRERFDQSVSARADGRPVAYLLGIQEFHGLELQVSPDVLIPRADTECLVEAALAVIPPDRSVRVVDLGTGSGAIALAIARARPQAQVMGVDVSEAALRVARANAEALDLQVDWQAGHWGDELPAAGIDVLVSNPPYIAEGDPHLPALRHEPQLALVSGADGLDALRHIIADAPRLLRPGGHLLLEHGWNQGEAVRGLLLAQGFSEVETEFDFGGNERVSRGRLA